MELRRLLFFLWLPALVLSCASMDAVNIIHEYDPDVDFTAFRKYDWFPVPEDNIKYGLIVKQITSELNRQITARGFDRDTQHPDFLIALHGGIQNKLSFPEWEYLSENYEKYAITRRFDIANYTDETFIIDFIDARTKNLAYRATATAYLSIEPSSEKREKKIAEAVKQILDDYARISGH